MDLDPIHGYAPAPSQFELDDAGALGEAARQFVYTRAELKAVRAQALKFLMTHRDAAKRLNAARGATKGHAEPVKPVLKSNLDMWDD